MAMSSYAEVYRGHDKHKHRPTRGEKGTRCPEWTHIADGKSVGVDMFAHDWALTRAQELLDTSVTDLASKRRYTTGDGIAFEVKPTNDGTFHGHPIPWNDVPAWLHRQWKIEGRVTRRQISRYSEAPNDFWAMDSDDAG
ncbi:hypothetical protein M9979_16650 [Sphingomonas sp. RP10(2022)]|uniref:Uncharacterized protein n=1 Tax=Sphingomonas liriopis TaxID=2949094 RepID=A0A9X2KRV8_9SPHN|nr:hypothetical protein [Sphingomonas liriopis]MCP3736497.1 hypothetical protein [Sphingomonas liriopis]